MQTLTILLLLVFGLQVQATFACEMADYSGAAEDCCCDDRGDRQRDTAMDGTSACCEYSQGLVVKGSDPAQDNAPITVGKSMELEPPPVLLAFVAIWFNQPLLPTKAIHGQTVIPPLTSGTQTYLATQRLRI